jgi:hypothetical protein
VRNGTLRVYMQDHHAAARAGVALARRTLGAEHELARRIADDRETLEQVMRHAGVDPSRIKVALAALGDQLGRVKADPSLAARPALGRLLALEALVVGVRGKEALWRALRVAREPRLSSFDFDALASSAASQADELEAERLRAASVALAEATACREAVA